MKLKQRVPNTPIYLGGGANGDNISTLIKIFMMEYLLLLG